MLPPSTRFEIQVPSYRSQYDVQAPEDIVEEVGRIYGYDNIAATPPSVYVEPPLPNRRRQMERRLRDYCVQLGCTETYNYSFSSAANNALWQRVSGKFKAIGLKNFAYTAGEKKELRMSLLDGLLGQLAKNQDRYVELRLFECANTFKRLNLQAEGVASKQLPPANIQESKQLILAVMPPLAATKLDPGKHQEAILAHFLTYRDQLCRLLKDCVCVHPKYSSFHSSSDLPQAPEASSDAHALSAWMRLHLESALHPKAGIHFYTPDQLYLGSWGLLHPKLERHFGLRSETLVGYFDIDTLHAVYEKERFKHRFDTPSVHPGSSFEISVLLPVSMGSHVPVDIIYSLAIPEVRHAYYLASYSGVSLGAEQSKTHISVSYRIDCSHSKRTLKGAELKVILDRIVAALDGAGIALRA